MPGDFLEDISGGNTSCSGCSSGFLGFNCDVLSGSGEIMSCRGGGGSGDIDGADRLVESPRWHHENGAIGILRFLNSELETLYLRLSDQPCVP